MIFKKKRSVLAFLLTFLLIFSVACDISPDQSGNENESQSATHTLDTDSGASSENNVNDDSKEDSTAEIQNIPSIESIRDAFFGDSDPADSYEEALDRSSRGELSGPEKVPDQAPTLAEYQPMYDGMYIRNNEPYYIDENTYVVVDSYGRELFKVYRGGGYISLEEVAAYLFAFGDVPANYSQSKKTDPEDSIWGINLRLNHSKFSGNTSKYPYEPVLPRINGCGGDLQYYELDIGTTGTDCDPSYSSELYNNGYKITRGAARIVYTRFDANRNSIIDPNEKYLFYTYNHYNDFQEYLNYFGGWGEMFGNITGGGTISSKYDYNPTEYVPVVMASLKVSPASNELYASQRIFIAVILPQDLYYSKKIA